MDVLADAASIASASECSESLSTPKKASLKNKKAPKLQHILMQLLNDESAPDAIWWLPGEQEFAVHSERFPAVLDKYLPGTKYASFIRRLHKMYVRFVLTSWDVRCLDIYTNICHHYYATTGDSLVEPVP